MIRSFRLFRVLAVIAVVFTTVLYAVPAGAGTLTANQQNAANQRAANARAAANRAAANQAAATSTGGGATPTYPTGTGTVTVPPSCPAGETLSLGTCQAPAITQTGTTFSNTQTFYCPTQSFFAGQSAVYSANALSTKAAKIAVGKEGNAWIALFCFNYQATKSVTVGACTATASETSPTSYADAVAAAIAAATTMADVACRVTPGSGTFPTVEWRSYSGLVTVSYTACVGGVLTSEPFTQTGTSPLERGFAYGTTQLQANSNSAAAAVAKGLANVTATVQAAAPTSATAATCTSPTPTTTTTTTPTSTTAPTTTTTTPTSTVTKVTNIWLPIVEVKNSAGIVLTTNLPTLRVTLIPLNAASEAGRLQTTTGAACRPAEVNGQFKLPNCEIIGAGTFLFNFESSTGLAINSNSITISASNAVSSATSGGTCSNDAQTGSTTCSRTGNVAASHVQTGSTPVYADGYTCTSGAHLDASGTNCVTTSTTAASHVQTGSTPIYTREQTGTTPTYGNVQTGSTPTYTYEQTGTTPTYGNVYTGNVNTYGIVGGGGWYAIRGCVAYYWWGCRYGTVGYGENPYVYGITGSYPTYRYEQTGTTPTYGYVQTGSTPTYTYEQTGTTPTYGNVQTGSTPTYGYACASGASLSGTTCVTTRSTTASHVQTGSTPVYGNGYTCPSGGLLEASGVSCLVSDTTAWNAGLRG